MTKEYFIVTCHGWSASNWIAHSLNLSNHVICTHSARNELANDRDLQSNDNLKKHINDLQKGYQKRQARSLDVIYDEIEHKGDSKYYCSVHVLRMRDIPVIVEQFGAPKRRFHVANVVRHPVDLVWSGYGQFKDLFRYDINELHWTSGKIVRQALEFSNYISQKYDLYMGDIEQLSFIGACSILESLKKDIDAYPKISQIPNLTFTGTYKMEEIVKRQDKFIGFCEDLGLSKIINDDYVSNVFSMGVVNKHKQDNKSISSEARFQSFLPWQKEVFLYFFDLHQLKEPYFNFGYDLDFLNPQSI